MTLPTYMQARDFGGNSTLIPRVPQWVDARVLAAGVAETYTIPAGCDVVELSYTGNTYVRANNTAAIPAADVTDGTGSDLNPMAYFLRPFGTQGTGTAITTLSFISASVNTVTIRAYRRTNMIAGTVPSTLPGLVVWIDAQDSSVFTFSTGNDIVGVRNKGNAGAGNAAQSTGSLQPLYVASAINGQPAIQFYDDGTAKTLEISDSAAFDFAGSGYTYFSVVQRVQDLGVEVVHCKWTTTGNQREWMHRISGTDKSVNFYSVNGTLEIGPSSTSSMLVGVPCITYGTWDNSAAVIGTSYNNETAVTTGGITAVFNGTSPYIIGAHTSTSAPLAAYVGELLFFNRILTVAEINGVLAYLEAKWGIALQ